MSEKQHAEPVIPEFGKLPPKVVAKPVQAPPAEPAPAPLPPIVQAPPAAPKLIAPGENVVRPAADDMDALVAFINGGGSLEKVDFHSDMEIPHGCSIATFEIKHGKRVQTGGKWLYMWVPTDPKMWTVGFLKLWNTRLVRWVQPDNHGVNGHGLPEGVSDDRFTNGKIICGDMALVFMPPDVKDQWEKGVNSKHFHELPLNLLQKKRVAIDGNAVSGTRREDADSNPDGELFNDD